MVSWVMWQGSMISWHKLLKSRRSPSKSPCHEIASTLAKSGLAHGELADAVQQCQLLNMSLTMYAKVCSPDSDERDHGYHVLIQYRKAHRSLTAFKPMQSCELLETTQQEGSL
eukprot:3152589-Amphidinium_carterae.1